MEIFMGERTTALDADGCANHPENAFLFKMKNNIAFFDAHVIMLFKKIKKVDCKIKLDT